MGNVTGVSGRAPIQRVLFVCRANVCRSPLMAATFAQQLDGRYPTWRVDGRGTDVPRSLAVCEVAASIAGDPATAGAKARALTAKQIDSSDLIIVASLRERAAVTRLRPEARARIFTLREALHLSDGMDLEARAVASDAPLIADFATKLDERRGIVVTPSYRSRRMPFRRRDHPYDIPDVHGGPDRRHHRVLNELQASTRELAARVQRFAEAAASVDVAG